MRWLPATTFARLALLIAAVVLALMVIMALAVRAFGIGPSGGIYADLVVGNVRLAQTTNDAALPANLTRAAQPPAHGREARLPAQLLIRRRVHAAFGAGSQVRFANDREARVWIRPEGATHWTGVRVPAFVFQTVSYGLLILAFAALAVLLAAWWFARHLSRPLEQLAVGGKALAAGEEWTLSDDDSAPREVRVVQSALAQASMELRRSVRERELLLAGVSHDLRTPLARLRLAIELQGGLPSAEREPMVKDVEEMDAIIGQFLDYVRDGRDEAEETVDLVALVRDVLAASARDGFAWTLLPVPERLPLRCRAMALHRAVRNLVRNAEIHGAPPRALGLEVSPASAADGGHVAILIRDTGPGLPAAVLAQVGRPFVRATPARGGAAGSGLGLSLVERVARTHRGELIVSSPAEGGFEARLQLPLAPL